MAETGLSGYWKGVAVMRTLQTVVHLYLEHNGNELSGKFESPDIPGPNSKGDMKGSINGDKVMLILPEKAAFHGQLTGDEPANRMIHGVIQSHNEETPSGTLTLFPQERGGIVEMYAVLPAKKNEW